MHNFYITTPIYYVNDAPHIGHAYTSIAADVIARAMRLSNHKVKFLTGTDEHGQKVEKAAALAGINPQEFVDINSMKFKELGLLLNLSNDDYIRTTEARHKKAAQAFWNKLKENNQIYLGKYAGWYSVRDEAYYQESELVNGKAPTGADVEWVEESSYFFKLSDWQEPLLSYYEQNHEFIAPETRRNEVISFVKSGLRDLSISRTTFKWGIQVPDDNKHVMYVWVDALINYLSAIGYPDLANREFKDFWPANLHLVGKDILRFHAVYWPALLMAAELEPPRRIFAHGWWTIEGEKISKSLGNAISSKELVDKYGVDQTRYFLLREVPFGNDGNFSSDNMTNRINSELANNIGNLVQRTLTLIQKNCDGKVPIKGESLNQDLELMAIIYLRFNESFYIPLLKQQFHVVLQEIINIATHANSYIDKEAPWVLKKENPSRMHMVLYTLAETIRCIAIMLQPFMPDSSSKILDQLSVPNDKRKFNSLSKDDALKSGVELPAPKPIFPRIESNAG